MICDIPKISVCIPAYNVGPFIGKCLDSLLQQTLCDIEIIVVDDCSTDNTVSVVESFLTNNSKICLFCNKENMGTNWTRREAYVKARGKYIAFCDPDDYMPHDALNILYQKAEDTNADLVVGEMSLEYTDGSNTPRILNVTSADTSKRYIQMLLERKISHSLCGKIFRREVVCHDDFITFKHHIKSNDKLLMYQIAKHVRSWDFIKENTYCYQILPGSITHRQLSEQGASNIFTTLKVVNEIWKNDPLVARLLARREIITGVDVSTHGLLFTKVKQIARNNGMLYVYSIKRIFFYFSFVESLRLLYRTYIISISKYIKFKCH